jgi:inorganic phosphate transporter, PiT family
VFDVSIWFFISSGLFLGWSLGANNAVTLFGTAVSSKMVRFRFAAIMAGIFTVAGSIFSGAGTTSTLTSVGGVNAIAGSFTVALSVAIAITWMTKAQLPVSTSQAVVGAIIGWNIFTGSPTDFSSLSKIVSSWLISPLVAGAFGFIIFKLIKRTVLTWRIHMLSLDNYTRIGLIVVGALASYSMGANNIANVMGMFVQATPFRDITIGEMIDVTGVQQLFLIGGLSIAFGIFTYGHKVIKTVGSDLFKISPITGFAVVLAEFIVLFLFTSQSLETFLLEHNLPSFPLVPLSATQAFIGAVIGVGLAKDPQSVDFRVFGRISIGWIVAPISAGVMSFILLYVVQNVFEQKVIDPTPYQITPSVIERLDRDGVMTDSLTHLVGIRYTNAKVFKIALEDRASYSNDDMVRIYQYATIDSFRIDSAKIAALDSIGTEPETIDVIRLHHGREFSHKIDFDAVVFADSTAWMPTGNKLHDKEMQQRRTTIEELMRVPLQHAR